MPGVVFGDEEVLVVPRRGLPPLPACGFVPGDLGGVLEVVRARGMFLPRGMVEDDPAFKQIIPYLVVRCADRVFLFQRSHGGDARLHGLYSIGVGGHVARTDVGGSGDPVQAGLRRELEEELVIDGPWNLRPVGLLNDDTTPVGRVHLGLVHVVEVARPAVRVREGHRLRGGLVPLAEVAALRDRLETWSRLLLDTGDLLGSCPR